MDDAGGTYPWTADDSCTYIIKANCGAPGFKVTSATATSSDVKLHYLEWDTESSSFTKSTTWTSEQYPIETSTPNVKDDQSAYLGGELDDLTWTGQTLTLPGLTLWAWFQQKLNEFDAFKASNTTYDAKRVQYNAELKIYSKRGFDLYGTFPWLFG